MTKLIVITGVSRGLGLAMTEQFIQAGHTVLGCARSRAAVEKLLKKFGPPHDFAVVDVADDQQVQAWANRLLTDMLEICYGEEAAAYTAIKDWVKKAVPFLLQLSPKDNGMPLAVPI